MLRESFRRTYLISPEPGALILLTTFQQGKLRTNPLSLKSFELLSQLRNIISIAKFHANREILCHSRNIISIAKFWADCEILCQLRNFIPIAKYYVNGEIICNW